MDQPTSQPFPQRLTEGYRAFLDDRFTREKSRYEELAESGQTPKIMLIGCCDSRVSPEVIFDASPGEMFVIRNMLPNLGGIDISPIILLLVIFFIQSVITRYIYPNVF